MRINLSDLEAENTVGGTAIISKDYMVIGFSTSQEIFPLKNCTYREARDFRDDLIEANSTMTEAAFDQFCKEQFQLKGWI